MRSLPGGWWAAAAVPAMDGALRTFRGPARDDGGTWMRDETTKYRLMTALPWIGPAAAPATPTLIAILEDGEIYRDTPVEPCDVHDHADDDRAGDDRELHPAARRAGGDAAACPRRVRRVVAAPAAVRRRFADGVRTHEQDGETRAFTVDEIRLADLAAGKIPEYEAGRCVLAGRRE